MIPHGKGQIFLISCIIYDRNAAVPIDGKGDEKKTVQPADSTSTLCGKIQRKNERAHAAGRDEESRA